jgi:BMFP domain-containing protein YqiC
VRDQVRQYVEAGMEMLSPAKARELARSLASGEGKDRIARVAKELKDLSARSRERLTETVQREVRKQLKAMGVVTRDDLDALRKRVRDLEKAASATGGSAKSSRRLAAPKKPSARGRGSSGGKVSPGSSRGSAARSTKSASGTSTTS